MRFTSQHLIISWTTILVLVLLSNTPFSSADFWKTKKEIKTNVFRSPKIELNPGSVANKIYYNVDFPRGHVALKSFNAELVDESGNSIPLSQIYLHHWIVVRYHQPKNVSKNSEEDITYVRNSGFCRDNIYGQYGVGSETRGTDTYIPDPYGIEIGNPKEIPKGYDEKWLINVHAIDTRGVKDRLGCLECRCDLYNVTRDADGNLLSPNYKGGLDCCPDNSKCKMKKGFVGPKRNLYLQYTIIWVNWEEFIIPAKIYIFDVTDIVKISNKSKGVSLKHDCKVEYQVEPCNKSNKNSGDCVDIQRSSFPMQKGGYVIYGVGHQHVGAIGTTLYGQDENVICNSIAKYGKGNEAGNETGYVVGMTTCYPKPGSIKILDGEILTLESSYNNTIGHSGVMGLFYFLVVEKLPHYHV